MTLIPETVVLVHGLWVHGVAMALMRRRIARFGYRALSYSYPYAVRVPSGSVSELTLPVLP